MNRYEISPAHAIFGETHVMLGDEDILQEGDEFGYLSQLLCPSNAACWHLAGGIGGKVKLVARGDQVYRRRRHRIEAAAEEPFDADADRARSKSIVAGLRQMVADRRNK